MESYDFLVIGSGSGLDVANAAVNQGQSVAVVEKGPLGGTCLNRGCIPSKQLLYHADVYETIERAGEFHIDAEVESVEFAEIVREVTADVGESSDSIRRGLRSSDQHRLYEGEGRFVDDHTIEIHDSEDDGSPARRGGEDDGSPARRSGEDDGSPARTAGEDDGTRVRAETILIAAGTRPGIPPIDGIEDVDYLTSREALQLETPPDRLTIVGGGYIAAELGHFFGTFGTDVTIIGRRPNLLPNADGEVAAAFTELYGERFAVQTGYAATGVHETGGEITVEAMPYEYDGDGEGGSTVEGGEALSVTGDELLVAAGRVPNTDTLDLENTAVETDDAGFVETDEYLRTDAEGVWALGDIVGEYLLKHSANHEARAVVRNLFGDEPAPVDYSAMPFAVFGSPEVAGVGATESELRAEGAEYATNTYRYDGTARGKAMHAEGFVKAIIDLEGAILGCHVVGPDASTLIQEVVTAMTAGSGTVRDIRESIHVHPALPEVIQRAFSGRFTRAGDGGHHHH